MTAPNRSSAPQSEPTPGAGSTAASPAHPPSPRGDAGPPKLELSPIKIAAGAVAAAAAAAIGSTLGVAGTIAGAAVASVVSASASAVLSHSLERGKYAALKALPLPAYGYSARRTDETWGLADVRDAETAVAAGLAGEGPEATKAASGAEAAASGGAEAKAETNPAPQPSTSSRRAQPRSWKPVAVVTALSFVVGTGAVTSIELARGRSFPGVDGGVLSNTGGGQQQHPSPMTPGGGSGPRGASTPPNTPTTTPSGIPTPTPATPSPTTPTPGSSATPSTAPSTSPSGTPTSSASTPPAPTGTGVSSPPGQATSPAPGQPSGTTSS